LTKRSTLVPETRRDLAMPPDDVSVDQGHSRRPAFCRDRWEAHYRQEKAKRAAMRAKLARARQRRLREEADRAV
jgi:hypothetical protein